MRFSDDVHGRAAVFQPRRRSTTMKRAEGGGWGRRVEDAEDALSRGALTGFSFSTSLKKLCLARCSSD